MEGDMGAAEVLDGLVEEMDWSRLNVMDGRVAVVFGAGPSLARDVRTVKSEKLHRKAVMVAADGAVKALLQRGILPEVNVTDLDGDLKYIEKANKRGSITVVHAHGDNADLLKEIVPGLKEPLGTTQTEEVGKLKNFGGFTDGDRSVFLAEEFNAELIILAGMDFGNEIGEFSGGYDREEKLKKLERGKGLLEGLAKESRAGILNLTSGGENLEGIPHVSAKMLRELF